MTPAARVFSRSVLLSDGIGGERRAVRVRERAGP
jgi:hypothetical protein